MRITSKDRKSYLSMASELTALEAHDATGPGRYTQLLRQFRGELLRYDGARVVYPMPQGKPVADNDVAISAWQKAA